MWRHVNLISSIDIDGAVLSPTLPHGDRGLWPFRKEQRAGDEQLVEAVTAARAG
jgi:hypothetical protein